MLQLVVLAGGLATRLRPVTEKIPKSLIEINGEPFIFHQLRLLKSKGFDRIIICTGYLGNQIEDLVGNGEKFDLDVKYSNDGDVLLGTGGAICKAFPLLESEFMITYGDSFLDFDCAGLNIFFKKNNFSAVMSIFKNENLYGISNVLYKDGNIIYSKTNRLLNMNYIDYGFSVVRKNIFNSYNMIFKFDLSVIFENLSMNNQLGVFEVANRFYEIGSFQGVEDIKSILKK